MFKQFFRLPYPLKIGLILFVLLLVLGTMLTGIFLVYSQEYENEITQTLHRSLAQKIIDDNPQLQAGEIHAESLEQAFHNMMILGPSFEFYLLNPDGSVQTYAGNSDLVMRHQVGLAPIHQFLNGSVGLPIKGVDPRSESGSKVFSVAPVMKGETLQGYLYIVVGGKTYEGVMAMFEGSHQLRLAAVVLGMGFLFSFVLAMLLIKKIFHPLRRLSQDMQCFQQSGLEESLVRLHHWKEHSDDEVERLGSVFNQLLIRLKNQYAKVKSADELRRELVSYVSHDLRTPLAALKGYLETWLIKNPQADETQISIIESALKNANQIEKLVEQLFELAHLEGEQVKLNHEVIPVAELVQDVLQKLKIEADKQQVSLDLEPKDPSLLVKADIQKLERALTNLVENAIRHTPAGGNILVKLEKQENTVTLQVQDTGCGIPEQDIPHIFDPHYRAANSVKSGKGLGGLGLAITRRIVQLHGSQIEVLSELGKGSAFRFKLDQGKY